MPGRTKDAGWVLVGVVLAVALMTVVRLAAVPPVGGPGLAVSFVVGSAVFCLAFPLLRGLRVHGPALLRAVALMLAGATLWDGVAIAAAPGWYGGEASSLTAAAALILFGVGVLLLVAVVLADHDPTPVAPAPAPLESRRAELSR